MSGLIAMIAMWRCLRFRFDCDDGCSRASKMFWGILVISNVSNRHGTTRKSWWLPEEGMMSVLPPQGRSIRWW